MSMRSPRLWAFVALCAIAIGIAGGYAARALNRSSSPELVGGETAANLRLSAAPDPPYLLVRSTAPDDSFRNLMTVPLSAPSAAGYVTPLECERAYFSAGRGVCLAAEIRGIVQVHLAHVFDEQFNRVHTIELTGLPSRARVSPDGRRAAITVFEHGHSYAVEGFSTRTTVIDTMTGRSLGDLEQFEVTREGRRFKAIDFNFWGLTFKADGNQFYATLASGGQNYLVEGDINGRTARVVRAGVECPSLSPDNTRVAYKSRVNQGMWQLRVLDLVSGVDTALSRETRSVDDQVDWLDDERVLYHITGSRGADIWMLRVDNRDAPSIMRQYSYSPSVVR